MSLALLVELTLRGSLVFLAAALADRLFAHSTTAMWRRLWWLLVPLAFLAPYSFPHPAFPYVIGYQGATIPGETSDTAVHVTIDLYRGLQIPAGLLTAPVFSWFALVWLAGALIAELRIVISTRRVQQQWKCERFCTDPALLNLLEDAKACAGIHAPIGLIVSDRINAPALLGWLRPRILLPSHLIGSRRTPCDGPAHGVHGLPDEMGTNFPATELKAVFLHELAHFKSLDIPLNWLFALVRVIHWFNPLAYLASAAWSRFVEEAADENAIRWTHAATGTSYGEFLLKTLGSCPGGPAPYGALAIGESIATLKRRILMIRHYPSKSNRGFVATAVVFILAALLAYSPTMAAADDSDDASKKNAVAAMQTWLSEIDAGDYAKSWIDAAPFFQKGITSDQWVGALKGVRTPLGRLLARKQASALLQRMPAPYAGKGPSGTFVVAQFETSFENLKAGRETVSFQKQDDGTWSAVGYYIKPL